MENTQKSLPKIYRVTYLTSDNQPISIGGEMTYGDCVILCEKLDELDPGVKHFPFRTKRLVWDEMDYDMTLDKYIIDADWYDEKKDLVRLRFSRNEVGCIPPWEIQNLKEVISKFNM